MVVGGIISACIKFDAVGDADVVVSLAPPRSCHILSLDTAKHFKHVKGRLRPTRKSEYASGRAREKGGAILPFVKKKGARVRGVVKKKKGAKEKGNL